MNQPSCIWTNEDPSPTDVDQLFDQLMELEDQPAPELQFLALAEPELWSAQQIGAFPAQPQICSEYELNALISGLPPVPEFEAQRMMHQEAGRTVQHASVIKRIGSIKVPLEQLPDTADKFLSFLNTSNVEEESFTLTFKHQGQEVVDGLDQFMEAQAPDIFDPREELKRARAQERCKKWRRLE